MKAHWASKWICARWSILLDQGELSESWQSLFMPLLSLSLWSAREKRRLTWIWYVPAKGAQKQFCSSIVRACLWWQLRTFQRSFLSGFTIVGQNGSSCGAYPPWQACAFLIVQSGLGSQLDPTVLFLSATQWCLADFSYTRWEWDFQLSVATSCQLNTQVSHSQYYSLFWELGALESIFFLQCHPYWSRCSSLCGTSPWWASCEMSESTKRYKCLWLYWILYLTCLQNM